MDKINKIVLEILVVAPQNWLEVPQPCVHEVEED